MEALKQFVERNKIRCSSEWTDSNPMMDDKSDRMNHWKVTLRRGAKQMTLIFSMGLGLTGEPDAEGVLSCLGSDSSSIENARGDFEEWASEYGDDTDSRRAEKTYKACEKQAAKLKAFLGDELYDQLLWHTEPL